MKQIRQGDILLVKVEGVEIPQDKEVVSMVILAEGELTGHAHTLIAEKILDWEIGGQRYIRILGNERGELSHQDHDPAPVRVLDPEVTYRVIPQKEVSLENEWRKVQD